MSTQQADQSGSATVSEESAEHARAIERLKVLARLSPYRLVKHAILACKSTRATAAVGGTAAAAAATQPIEVDSYYDRFDCAALFIDISGFSKITGEQRH